MQVQLPFFSDNTKLITPALGFRKDGDMVYYLHNGSPIFCHEQKDLRSYRYILGNLVEMRLCSAGELSKAPGVPIRSVQRYAKTFRDLLYNFNHDPSEKYNVNMNHPEIIKRITKIYENFESSIVPVPAIMDAMQKTPYKNKIKKKLEQQKQ